MLKQAHICFIEGIGRYRSIHLTLEGSEVHQMSTIISDTTLDDFESQLSNDVFLRLHRSYIANLNQIMGLVMESRKHLVSLRDIAIKIPVSRSKVNNLKMMLSGVSK
jgi:DNA-binding LytR/AlgR family response regulator